MEDRSVVRAYAKINLGLRILRKRPDGFHDLETVFHRINLYDDIECATSDAIAVVSNDPAAPGGESNLCHRAAAELARRSGVKRGVSIQLTKRIPVGAGLGGGSSDAASLLLALPRFWGIDVPPGELFAIATALGSDVPYFLSRGSAEASGRGEILDYFRLDLPYSILLCNPGIHVATAWAYSQIVPRSEPDRPSLRSIIEQGVASPDLLTDRLVNAFEEPVFRKYPEIRRLKERMLGEGACYAAMSGSGSSVFGFFPRPAEAEALATALHRDGYLAVTTPPHFQGGSA